MARITYQNSSDPRKLTANQRSYLTQHGDELQSQFQNYGTGQQGKADATASYLNSIENPIAQGNGGYNAGEVSQIEMTPQQQQDMITKAGISAGTGTAAGVEAADRATNAAGGNPLAMATYRARAARQQGAQAGDAMTNARVATQAQQAQNTENVGQTRLGQQDQALGYYTGQQQEHNQNAQNANALQEQNYGTQGNVTNAATGLGFEATQTPTTFDKAMGGVGGFLSALADGDVTTGGTPAVVGEAGPEKVIDLAAARSIRKPNYYMADGDISPDPMSDPMAGTPDNSWTGQPVQGVTPVGGTGSSVPPPTSWWQKLVTKFKQPTTAVSPSGAGGAAGGVPVPPNGGMQASMSLGKGLGHLASMLSDGGSGDSSMNLMPSREHKAPAGLDPNNGIFTKPTKVNLQPGEAAVPLTYRPHAKIRPSMAMNTPAARVRQPYGGTSAHAHHI